MARKVMETVWYTVETSLTKLVEDALKRGIDPEKTTVTWDGRGEAFGVEFSRPETPEERTARLVRDRLVKRQREYEAKKAKAAEAFKVERMEKFEREEYERLKAKFS